MWISAKATYACLAIIELASSPAPETPRRVRDIAKAQGIPDHYLVQILLQLKAAGMVRSTRGNEGGYLLLRRPEELTVAEVIGAIDGPPPPARWAGTNAAIGLLDLLRRAWNAQHGVLASTTIADLATASAIEDWVV